MYEYELFRFLAKWRKAGKYPPASAWPGYLQFGSSIWATINKLHSFTATDMHEYEASFFAEGEKIITTKPIRGSEASVTASHSFQVKYIPDNGRGVYQKQVILDGSVINRETVLPNNVPQEIVAGFLFNVHTHPKHFNSNNEETYGFFSPVDVGSLLKSKAYLMGLVTSEFWLCCKTDRVISEVGTVGEEMLMRITEEAYSGNSFLNDVIRTEMKNWGLIFYRGEFNGKLIRI